VVLTAEPGLIGKACAVVRAEIDSIDGACSRFRADSELSRVNAAAGERIAVSGLFGKTLEAALRAAELTAGDVDPTCGMALESAGYDRDFAQLQVEGARVTVTTSVPVPGWRTVEWDRGRRLVRILPGTRLDFGATAKALAADLGARRACEATGCGVLVSLSGDIATCGRPPEGGWRVRVTDDHRHGDEHPGQTITLTQGGLATSSTTVRRWRVGDIELHHIIDPLTGYPVDSCWRTVSIAAATCVDANTAATAAILRGPSARHWLTRLRLPGRLVARDGSVVTVAQWPVEQLGGAE
jgi:thiamine biosynthesis lipoprotein